MSNFLFIYLFLCTKIKYLGLETCETSRAPCAPCSSKVKNKKTPETCHRHVSGPYDSIIKLNIKKKRPRRVAVTRLEHPFLLLFFPASPLLFVRSVVYL
jgi:hypothetical protein